MALVERPALKPANPRFSTGPTAKRPGWSPEILKDALTGRSHRSGAAKARLRKAIDETRRILSVPADYRMAIVPASDTGAMEMALWSLLGARGVDVLAWESFGSGWADDITRQLKLPDVRVLRAGYGELVDLAQVDFDRDVVFTWNGTTSGVRIPDRDWIPVDRQGLTICDATSAAFAQRMPLDRLDVITFSWQKVMGGEAQHGMLILSPRAAERLKSHSPAWPVPKVFRLTSGGKLIEGVFAGETLNTPSMLCVEDYLDALAWADSVGGLDGLIARADANAALVAEWVGRTDWVEFLPHDPATRSNTSVCLKLVEPAVAGLPAEEQAKFVKGLCGLLEKERAAFDIESYRDAPPGLRIWCGATVEPADLQALFPWLDWAFATMRTELRQAA